MNVYAGFLYGVNIPGGVWLKAAEVEAKLRESLPGIGRVRCIGDADNLLMETTVRTESEVASQIETVLGIKGAVVVSPDSLRRIHDASRTSLKGRGFPDSAPFVVTLEGIAWEFGVVLSSIDLPTGAVFPASMNARALEVIERRALLVQKRCATGTGARIMWGSTVIRPLRTQLRRTELPVGYLTSRAFARIGEVIAAADNRESRGARPVAAPDT
jgi:hypothetical protein